VVALFLVLAGGSAFATSRYLITSKKQIKPSVRRALRGATGPSGATGMTGATGPTVVGSVLPSGQTETGVYFAEGTAASAPTPAVVTSGGTTDCPGSVSAPAAASGYLCVYVGINRDIGEEAVYDPYGDSGDTTSRWGAGFIVDSNAPGNFYSDGTWAVTAP
jgi:hypothetical protein